jgi:hypothetical protein
MMMNAYYNVAKDIEETKDRFIPPIFQSAEHTHYKLTDQKFNQW